MALVFVFIWQFVRYWLFVIIPYKLTQKLIPVDVAENDFITYKDRFWKYDLAFRLGMVLLGLLGWVIFGGELSLNYCVVYLATNIGISFLFNVYDFKNGKEHAYPMDLSLRRQIFVTWSYFEFGYFILIVIINVILDANREQMNPSLWSSELYLLGIGVAYFVMMGVFIYKVSLLKEVVVAKEDEEEF